MSRFKKTRFNFRVKNRFRHKSALMQEHYDTLMDNLPDGEFYIEIGKVRKGRSILQNNYIHGGVFTPFIDKTGHTMPEIKMRLKIEIFATFGLRFMVETLEKPYIYTSTADWSTVEMNEFNKKAQILAATEYGFRILDPDEWRESQGE